MEAIMEAIMEDEIIEHKRIDRKLVRKSHILDIYEDTIELPDKKNVKFDFLAHKGASAVIPVMDDGRIMLVKQYRNAIDRHTLELPAGGRNSLDEDYRVAAERELKEETGCTCEELYHLITVKTAVAFSNENIEIYVATGLKKGEQSLDPEEYIDVKPFSLEEINEMVFSGKIQDAKTVSGLMAYQQWKKL